jgi:hypothetical protein
MEENIELSFPFGSVKNELGIPDRPYTEHDFAKYFSQFISNGVYPNPSNGLAVESLNNNMVVTVRRGSGYINGHGYVLQEDMPVNISPSNPAYNRKDNIVLQLNHIERWIKVIYKEGVANANPQPPELLRNDDIYELKLAEILVKSGTQVIKQADITSTKLNSDVCGIVHAVVDSVDTTEIFNQYENYLNQKIEEWNQTKAQQEQDFNARQDIIQAWYDSVKVDIAKLQTFDFDNLFAFVGCTKQDRKVDDKYISTLKYTLTGKKIAELEDEKVGEDYVSTLSIYADDGITIESKIRKTDKRVIDGYDTIIESIA